MKKLGLSLLFLVASNHAQAESAWYFDSCMENVPREFSCAIEGKTVAIDLQSQSSDISYNNVDEERIYGLFLENVKGGKLYISCDDSGRLKSVQFEKNDVKQTVVCE